MRMDHHQLCYYAMNVTFQQNPIQSVTETGKQNSETDTSTKQQKEGRQLVTS